MRKGQVEPTEATPQQADRPAEADGGSGKTGIGRTRMAFPACLALVLLVVGIYIFSLNFGLVYYDDDYYILTNPQVRNGLTLQGAQWAFTSVYSSNWHPLTWISHMLDCSLFGLNFGGHHLVNLVLHGANSAILFLLLMAMTGAFWRSLLVAALFAAHPLHVESVAWLAERKDLLSAFFALLSLGAYARYVRGGKTGKINYALSLALFAAGLLSKPMVVTLPFLMLLLDYWPLGRTQAAGWKVWLRLAVEKAPFFVFSAAVSVMTVHAQKGALSSLEELPFPLRLGNALLSYAGYLQKTFFPADLAAFYPFPGSIDPGAAVVAAAALAAVTLISLRLAKALPFLPVGWFWYAGTLVPVIGLVQVGSQAMADRYTYIPLVGIFVIVSWGAEHAVRRFRIGKAAVAAGAAFAVAILAVLSLVQVSHWQDGFTLFRHAAAVTRDNYVAHNNLGRHFGRNGQFREAETSFLESLRIAPYYPAARQNLAYLHFEQGRVEQAIGEYRDLLQSGEFPEARLNLSIALLETQNPDEAVEHLSVLLAADPRNAPALNVMGIALISRNRPAEALAKFREAHALDPGNPAYAKNIEKAGKRLSQGQNE